MKDVKWENWSGFFAAKVFARLAKVLIFQFSYPRKSLEFFLIFKLVTERGFDIFSGRTLLNWQARFFDHFFIPRAHEFSNGSIERGKVQIKRGLEKKNHPIPPQFQAQHRNSNLYHVFPYMENETRQKHDRNTVAQKGLTLDISNCWEPSSWIPYNIWILTPKNKMLR